MIGSRNRTIVLFVSLDYDSGDNFRIVFMTLRAQHS